MWNSKSWRSPLFAKLILFWLLVICASIKLIACLPSQVTSRSVVWIAPWSDPHPNEQAWCVFEWLATEQCTKLAVISLVLLVMITMWSSDLTSAIVRLQLLWHLSRRLAFGLRLTSAVVCRKSAKRSSWNLILVRKFLVDNEWNED